MSNAREPKPAGKRGIDRLLEIVSTLRSANGCPWDREQTIESLKFYLIEESYETLDAIESGDPARHAEELGDVLLQIALHAQIRNERSEFDFDDVANTIADKLIRRHPHVFGETKVNGAAEVLNNWEIIKSREKGREDKSILEGVPSHLPALQKAQRIQSRASRVGFDWDDVKDVISKVDEELVETKQALSGGNIQEIRDEIGDLLFAIVNLARFQKIEAEDCLRSTIAKFSRRFNAVEKRVRSDGKKMSDCSLAEMDAHWNEIKKLE